MGLINIIKRLIRRAEWREVQRQLAAMEHSACCARMGW
jgi:hypothetical protein